MLNGWRVIKGYDVYVHNDFIKYGISEKGPDAHTTFPYFYHKGLKQWIPCDCKGVEVHEFLSDDYTMGNYDLEYKGAYATKEMELLDLKERIFSEFYDARLLFKKLTVGQKKNHWRCRSQSIW